MVQPSPNDRFPSTTETESADSLIFKTVG